MNFRANPVFILGAGFTKAFVERAPLMVGGLVTSDKEGRSRTCSLAPQGLEPVEQWISERKALWERRLNRLSDALERATARKDGRD
jgi:DNA-binding transcriptional ArsR family regulator